jgi:hypothetical protein
MSGCHPPTLVTATDDLRHSPTLVKRGHDDVIASAAGFERREQPPHCPTPAGKE